MYFPDQSIYIFSKFCHRSYVPSAMASENLFGRIKNPELVLKSVSLPETKVVLIHCLFMLFSRETSVVSNRWTKAKHDLEKHP